MISSLPESDGFMMLFLLMTWPLYRYKFQNYPRLRSPNEYSKGSLLHKKREAERMLEWQVKI